MSEAPISGAVPNPMMNIDEIRKAVEKMNGKTPAPTRPVETEKPKGP